jgi:hypothetical protein
MPAIRCTLALQNPAYIPLQDIPYRKRPCRHTVCWDTVVTTSAAEPCRDQGPAQLANFSANPNRTYPILGCNVDASKEPLLAGVIQPYTIITTPSGIKVGLHTQHSGVALF